MNFLFFIFFGHAACEILFPQPVIEPRPWQWNCRILLACVSNLQSFCVFAFRIVIFHFLEILASFLFVDNLSLFQCKFSIAEFF